MSSTRLLASLIDVTAFADAVCSLVRRLALALQNGPRLPGESVVISRYRSRAFVLSTVVAALFLVSAVPSLAEAQRRHRRPVVVTPYHHHWLYDPWWGPWGGPYRYPPYIYAIRDTTSSLRLEVTPRQAQVFVDGYYAGIVDEFDGVFQRLRIEPGGHVITLYLEGYRTVEQDLYLRPGADQRLRLTLEPLAPGEQAQPPTPPQAVDEPGVSVPPVRGVPRDPYGPGAIEREAPRAPTRFGTLSLRVQPADAEIFIDGERWSGPTDRGFITIQLTEGRHRLEVRKTGLATYTEDVLIRRDRTLTLNVAL